MEPIATVHYGCGILVTDIKFIKPEYHPTISGAWIPYQSALNVLRQKYEKYLVDNFDYEQHFVQYEIVDI